MVSFGFLFPYMAVGGYADVFTGKGTARRDIKSKGVPVFSFLIYRLLR
jgi:hypothetical protein